MVEWASVRAAIACRSLHRDTASVYGFCMSDICVFPPSAAGRAAHHGGSKGVQFRKLLPSIGVMIVRTSPRAVSSHLLQLLMNIPSPLLVIYEISRRR